jgi:histidine ammonia-lyase
VSDIERLVAAQAIDLRGGLRLGQGTQRIYDEIRSRVAFQDEDGLLALR